jgi:hypothetical protein
MVRLLDRFQEWVQVRRGPGFTGVSDEDEPLSGAGQRPVKGVCQPGGPNLDRHGHGPPPTRFEESDD